MKTKITTAIIIFLMMFSSCHDEFLQDKAYSIITEDNYFRTSSDALTALNGVYRALTESGMYQSDLLMLNEYTSECVTTRLNVGDAYSRWDTWNFEVGHFSGTYSGHYRMIERANQVIANVPKCEMLESLKQRVIGEATFLRSLAYFNLVRIYGGVPLKLTPTTDFRTLSFPRATAAEVYTQIIKDLTWVYESAGIPKTSAYGAGDKGRVSRSAVQALLGKVYLTNIDFYKSFETGDLRREVTFHDRMKIKIGTVSNIEVYFDPATDPLIGTWRRTDDNSLVARSIVNASVPGFRKFIDTDITARGNAEEPNYVILRYSDVLLMLAEALNETNNGPNTEAYSYLNMVRRRAFGKPIGTPDAAIDYANLSKASFREAVYTERRKEFVIEGHAWFDGKRFWDIFTKKVADSSIGADPNLNIRPKQVIDLNRIRQDKYKLMPFSITQMELNKELVQNPGWE